MDFDVAKENIRPLASGRNASILQMSISQSSRELFDQRREHENLIHTYNGDDPLEPWYDYISWIEQSFPSGGKESGLTEVTSKCLRRFESEERYYQDRRMIKLFIKFLENRKDSAECYQQLFNAGIGTMVSDFYIAWAYCYDSAGQMRKADEVFRRGIECRAQPLEELKEAHQHFGFAVAQRTLYKDDEDALLDTNREIEERRSALSSLRGYNGRRRKGEVGSIRTGIAIKSLKPGKFQNDGTLASTSSLNARVSVLTDENENPNAIITSCEEDKYEQSNEIPSMTVVRSIIDKTRHQENQKEPGPWNKVHDKKNAKKLMRQKKPVHELAFNIHEDKDEDDESLTEFANDSLKIDLTNFEKNYEKPFRYPENFVNKNRPQPDWILPVTTECEVNSNTLPRYNKSMIYPRPNREFQHEELCAFFFFKKRGIQNEFRQRYNAFWGNDISVPIRLYPNFARQSKPQTLGEVDNFFAPPIEDGKHMVPLKQIYDIVNQEEFQSEELLASRLRTAANVTVTAIEDMDETMCASSNNEQVQRRKSLFPIRRSLAIRNITAKIETNKESIDYSEKEIQKVQTKSAITNSVSKEIADSEIKEDFTAHKKNQVTEDFPHTKEESTLQKSNESDHIDFNFKTPALPMKSIPHSPEPAEPKNQIHRQPLNKLPFEIYVEENSVINSKMPGATGIFDAEETCSTQVFNNFIKTQSASTPKVAQKQQKRQFGVLLEVPITIPAQANSSSTNTESSSYMATVINEISPITTTNSPSSPDIQNDAQSNTFSPLPRKQLSTILETSEHGTTQGTHSTAASTKSTIGSQESEFGDAAVNIAANANTYRTNNIPKEITSYQSTAEILEMMREVQLKDPQKPVGSSPHKQQNEQSANFNCTPATGEKFSIYVDNTETLPKLPKIPLSNAAEAGNFERLFECEDTGTGCFAVQSSLRFQEDKTATITKIGYPRAFPDDVTETIPQINDSIFSLGQQKTPNPVKHLCPKNSSTLFEASLLKATNKSSPKKLSISTLSPKTSKILPSDDDDDDCLEFFKMSPHNAPKSIAKVNFNTIRKATHLTPLGDTKTKLDYLNQTPDTITFNKFNSEKNNSKAELLKFFESEMMEVDEDANRHKIFETTTSSKGDNLGLQTLDRTIPNEREKYSTKFVQKRLEGLTQTSSSAIDSENVTFNKNEKKTILGEEFSMTEKMKKTRDNSFNLKATPHTDDKKKELSLLPDISYQIKKLPPGYSTRITTSPPGEGSLQEISLIDETQQPSVITEVHTDNTNVPKKNSFIPSQDSLKFNSSHIEVTKKHSMNISNQVQEKQRYSSNIPKPLNTKKSLMETNTTASKLRSTEIQKQDSFPNISNEISFIPETQDPPSKTTHSIEVNPTRLSKSVLTPHFSTSKVDEFVIGNTLKDVTKVSVIDKRTNNHQLSTSSKSNNLMSEAKAKEKQSGMEYDNSNRTLIFELNAETEMFSTGLSTVTNSTMLPRSSSIQAQQQNNSIYISKEQSSEHQAKTDDTRKNNATLDTEDNMSIYFKNSPRTPLLKMHSKSWSGSNEDIFGPENVYLHHAIDLNETAQRIQNMCDIQQVNPFNSDLLNAFLDQIDFVNYLNDLNNTMLVGKVRRLNINSIITVNDKEFKILKLIGEGAYGTIYSGIDTKSGKMYAFKQERPPNYWEYYICLEVKSRITNEEILSAYMDIDYALIGNNSSIFISPFSSYGSIINVCNKIKKQTLKNMDEYVVMHLACELLEIIDHLHAACIIHADVKADNFLLMKKLSYNSRQVSLQLIDFGVSIDMKQFKKTQTFKYVQHDNAFKCVEMRENRPWTYQLDLYGLAGVLHVMLFGKYMDIEKRNDKGIWMPKTHMPRYINKLLWERIFRTLLNVRDCSSMPNLQQLRSLIKEEMVEKERYVINKIAEFNKALDS